MKKETPKNKKEKVLVLLDSHAIIHRAFHALPTLTNPQGEQMGAVYGFATILLRILDELKPDYLAAAFDMPGPTFRHVAYERYKAQRPEAPDELIGQFKNVRRLCQAFDIPVLEREGYEADDVIGTIAEAVAKKNKDIKVIIVTGDLDTLQLVNPQISVYTMRKGLTDTMIYDEKAVKTRYGLKPLQLADFKGLRGDPSDNIPGVKGIGEKTASELLKKYGSIEKLYASLKKAKLSPSVREKLETQKDEAFFSKTLATINKETPITLSLKDAEWHGPHGIAEVEKLFREFGFTSLMRRLGYLKKDESLETKPTGNLFSASSAVEPVANIPRAADFLDERELGFFVVDDDVLLVSRQKHYRIPSGLAAQPAFRKLAEEKRERVFFDEKQFLKKINSTLGYATDFDILIAVYLLKAGERSYTIERAAREAGIPASGISAYTRTFEIKSALEKRLKDKNLWKVFAEMEMPVVPILAEIEERGMMIDTRYLTQLSDSTSKTLQSLEKEIYKLAGKDFNINSPKQVSETLFDVLKLDGGKMRKTEGGAISTDARELAKLKDIHPIIAKILEYREIAKLQGTYIDALPKLIGEDGALHTTLNQTLTATGRLSSSDPNLQNIPTRSELGKLIRNAFVARPGYELVSFDYSQIELRVAAAMSGDEKMKETFWGGGDIHTMTAMEVNNLKTPDEVTPTMRYAAKALNFGILYGMGPRAFSESAGIPFADAKKFMAEYFNDFPKIKGFMQKTLENARKTGYVETMLGRRRYIPEINSPNFRVRAEAERMAMNAPIQGTATGDIVKLAMIEVDKFLKRQATRDKGHGTGHILMQVHDELLCEIKSAEVKKLVPKIKKLMEEIYDIGVPLAVDVKVGKNWGEMRKM
ncbi:MAG: DNA polymerase I [Candidatus Sungbacteria bacterium]|nr:DNA polymerase I [Candidatus Sungbacteria bacterium]